MDDFANMLVSKHRGGTVDASAASRKQRQDPPSVLKVTEFNVDASNSKIVESPMSQFPSVKKAPEMQ
jgi:hypothetical protein